MKKLVGKQKPFVEYYLQTFNATKAAELAGYKGNNQTLRAVGYENLTKPHIKAAIDRRISEIGVTSDEVIARLSAMARGEIPTKTVDGVEQFHTESALVHLGRYYKLFTDRLQIQQDWRSPLIRLLYDGTLIPEQIREELGDELAEELFNAAGISITQNNEAEETSSEDN